MDKEKEGNSSAKELHYTLTDASAPHEDDEEHEETSAVQATHNIILSQEADNGSNHKPYPTSQPYSIPRSVSTSAIGRNLTPTSNEPVAAFGSEKGKGDYSDLLKEHTKFRRSVSAPPEYQAGHSAPQVRGARGLFVYRPRTSYSDSAKFEKKHSQYGTFPGSQLSSDRRKRRKLKLSFADGDQSSTKTESHTTVSIPDMSVEMSSSSRDDMREPLLSKDEVSHLCDDVGDNIADTPDFAHWRSAVMATLLCCPLCGFVAFVCTCKSLYHAKHKDSGASRRMLRHSGFCLRLAVIFGIILWFIGFMILVMYIDIE